MGSAPFRLNRSGLMLAVVSAALASEAHAAAGRTEFVIGGVTVARNGVERPLARGTELDTGDTVHTNNGRAQIRFTDGAYVSLQPNTEYSIRDYQYDGAGAAEERGFFGLLKGAMRTVTGAIGRINRNAYRIATPTATVGIRGTGGVIQVEDDGSTRVIGTSGIWSLTNPAGSVDVPAGTSAVAPSDPSQPPQETSQQPTSRPAPIPEEEPEFVAGEEVDDAGLPVIPTPTQLVSGSGYAAVLSFSFFSSPFVNTSSTSDAVFDSVGRLTSISGQGQGFFDIYSVGSGNHADFGTDGILAWGRWSGDALLGVDTPPQSAMYGPNDGLHYIVGMPTATMPASGTATYSLVGATQPTFSGNIDVPGSFTGTLNVDFAALKVGLDLRISMSDRGYNVVGDASLVRNTAFFSGSGQTLTVIESGNACASGCTPFVSGFFAGTNAERAGLGYHVRDFLPGATTFRDVHGTAAFQKQ